MNSGFIFLIVALFIGLIITTSLGIYYGNQLLGQVTARNLAIGSLVIASVTFVALIWAYYNAGKYLG